MYVKRIVLSFSLDATINYFEFYSRPIVGKDANWNWSLQNENEGVKYEDPYLFQLIFVSVQLIKEMKISGLS